MLDSGASRPLLVEPLRYFLNPHNLATDSPSESRFLNICRACSRKCSRPCCHSRSCWPYSMKHSHLISPDSCHNHVSSVPSDRTWNIFPISLWDSLVLYDPFLCSRSTVFSRVHPQLTYHVGPCNDSEAPESRGSDYCSVRWLSTLSFLHPTFRPRYILPISRRSIPQCSGLVSSCNSELSGEGSTTRFHTLASLVASPTNTREKPAAHYSTRSSVHTPNSPATVCLIKLAWISAFIPLLKFVGILRWLKDKKMTVRKY